MAENQILKNASKISLGLVLVLFWLFAYLRAEDIFTTNTEAMKSVLLTYILATALVFSFDALASRRTERALFKVGFIRAFPKFLIAGALAFLVFYIFGSFSGDVRTSVFAAVSVLGVGVIVFHAFFVAIIEELIFRGWLVNELRARGIAKTSVWILQALVFAFFHYALTGSLLTIAIYIPLAFLFMFVKEKFSPVTNMANAGVHFAWNLFILGFFT